jgi:hypothetical protein
MCQMQALRSILMQYSNLGQPFQHLHAVWGLLKTLSQIFASIVNNLMSTIFPLKTIRCIIYFAFVGYVSWCTILPIVPGKFILAEALHPL